MLVPLVAVYKLYSVLNLKGYYISIGQKNLEKKNIIQPETDIEELLFGWEVIFLQVNSISSQNHT